MDVATTLILALMASLPTCLMFVGFSFNKAKAVACLISASVLWLVLVPTFPVVSGLTYTYLSYIFFVPAFLCFFFALPPAISMWRTSQKEGWEDDDEE